MEKESARKKRRNRSAIGIGVLALLATSALLVMGTPNSKDDDSRARCTLRTLKGIYVFEARGVTLNGDGTLPYAEAGWQSFDGAGNSVGVFSFSVDGVAIDRQVFFESTYELSPFQPCVFTVFAPVGDEVLTFDLYGTPKGTAFSYFAPGFSGQLVKP